MLLNSLEPNLSPTSYNILGGDFNCFLHPGATNPHTREFTWTGRDTRTMNSFICTCINRFYTSQTSPYTLDSTILTYPHSDHDLISISWPQPSTTLCKLEHRECKRLERDLTHLKQRATTGNSSDKENYLLAKQKLTVLEQRDLEAVKIRTKARFTEEGEKSTGYVYSLKKKKQADKSIHSQKRISTLSLQLVTF